MKPSRYSSNILQRFLREFLFVGLLVALFTSCDYSDVEVREIGALSIEKLDKNGLTLNGAVKVYNPNSYKIKIVSTDADVYLEGRKAGKAKLLKNITIPANFEDYVEVSIRADFDEAKAQLLPIILGAAIKRGADIQIKGDIRAKSFLISKKFDFEYAHRADF